MPWTEFMGFSRDCLWTLSKHFPTILPLIQRYQNMEIAKAEKKIIVNIKIRSEFNKTFASSYSGWTEKLVGELWRSFLESSTRVGFQTRRRPSSTFWIARFYKSTSETQIFLFRRRYPSCEKFLGSLFTHFCHLIYMKSSFMNWVSVPFFRHRNHFPSCFRSSHDIPPNFSTSFVKCLTETVQMCSSAFQDARDRYVFVRKMEIE